MKIQSYVSNTEYLLSFSNINLGAAIPCKFIGPELADEIAKQGHVTEQLKADNMLLRVQIMNNIRNSAAEIVNGVIIFA